MQKLMQNHAKRDHTNRTKNFKTEITRKNSVRQIEKSFKRVFNSAVY